MDLPLGENLFFDPTTGRLYAQSEKRSPTIDEFMQDPSRYPNYVLTVNYENGKMEIKNKA